jgi:methylmalonyl-CoA mutase N-terminal domain/subunit
VPAAALEHHLSGYHTAEAGATPVQEIAFTIANAKEYVAPRWTWISSHRGCRLSSSPSFVARMTVLEEVARFRAARRIWARIMAHEFGARNPRPQMLQFHTQTAGMQLTAQQPGVNLVRVALRCWQPSTAAPSRWMPTPTTRPSPCQRRMPPGWRCGPSRSSRTNRT